MAGLEIHLLGGFQLTFGGEPIPPIASHAGRQLFAYLAVQRGRRLARAELAARFWPDVDEARGRRRLSQALWQIQDTLGEFAEPDDLLRATPEWVAFDPRGDWWLDTLEFERRVSTLRDGADGHPLSRASDLHELRAAVDLYRGDFLSGYYDDWVVREQERLQTLYVDALGRLVDLTKGHGDYEQSLTYARRLAAQDPLREDAHREIMRLSVLLGRPADALRQYERCRTVLMEELGTEPAADTQRLHAKVQRQRHAPLPPDEPAPLLGAAAQLPLIGRERERAAIIDQLEGVLAGRGRAVLVEAEPGVGKTRLVSEAADDAQWRGFTHILAACEDGAARRPYGALITALEPALTPLRVEQLMARLEPIWLAEAASVLPALAPRVVGGQPPDGVAAGARAERKREALARLLVALSAVAPLMLTIEDVHWADDETLGVLRALAPRVPRSSLLVVVTYRDQEARDRDVTWDAVRALDRHARPIRLLLEPLTAFATAELVRSSSGLGQSDATFVNRLHRVTGGNPLFLLETLASLDGVDDVEGLAEVPLTESMQRTVIERASALTEPAREGLDRAAVIGSSLDLDVFIEASAIDRVAALDQIHELVRRGFLRESQAGLAFAHEQLRQAVYLALDEGSRRVLHGEIAEAFARVHPQRHAELAHHYVRAERPREALPHLQAVAAESESIHAYGTAAHHYRQAAGLLDEVLLSTDERARLLLQLERVLDVLGARGEQYEVLDRAAPFIADDLRIEFELRRARLAANTDEFEAAARHADAALGLARTAPDRSAALYVRGMAHLWAGRAPAAVADLTESVAVAADDEEALANALMGLGRAELHVQRYEDAEAHLGAALERLERLGDLSGQAETLGRLAALAGETGRLDEAAVTFDRALDLCRRIGALPQTGTHLLNLGNLHMRRGALGDALAAYDRAEETFADLGHRRGLASLRLNRGWLRCAFVGDLEAARRDVDAARTFFREVGDSQMEATAEDTMAEAHRLGGDRTRARAALERGLELAGADERPSAALDLVRTSALVEFDARERAAVRELVDRGREVLDASGLPADPLLDVIDALTTVEDDPDRAAELARAAASRASGDFRPDLVLLYALLTLEQAGDQAEVSVLAEQADAEHTRRLSSLPEELQPRARALATSERLREVIARHAPRTASIRVASAEAPTGRPLQDDELVEVRVTLSVPGEERPPSDRRREAIVRIAEQAEQQGGALTVRDLASLLDVSPATIRRDLAALRDDGVAVATRGRRVG